MAFLRAKPIGVMGMIDQGEQDDKVHCFNFQLCCPCAADCVLSMHSQHTLPEVMPHMHHDCTQRQRLGGHEKRHVHAMQLSPDGNSMFSQIIAVHADDPEFKGYDDISQLPKHRLAEIRRQALPQCVSYDSIRHAQCTSLCQDGLPATWVINPTPCSIPIQLLLCCADSSRTIRRWASHTSLLHHVASRQGWEPSMPMSIEWHTRLHVICAELNDFMAASLNWDASIKVRIFVLLQNEHKEVKVDEILGREEAEKAIKEAMVGSYCLVLSSSCTCVL